MCPFGFWETSHNGTQRHNATNCNIVAARRRATGIGVGFPDTLVRSGHPCPENRDSKHYRYWAVWLLRWRRVSTATLTRFT
jgi:hypothetical protein